MLVGFGLGRWTAPVEKPVVVSPGGISQPEPEPEEPAWQAQAKEVNSASAADLANAAAIGSPRQRERALEEVLAKAGL